MPFKVTYDLNNTFPGGKGLLKYVLVLIADSLLISEDM